MRGSKEITSIFSFLNEQLPQNVGPGRQMAQKIKTNTSLLSEKSDLKKNRIPTINKDYSFVNLQKNLIDENQKHQEKVNEVLPSFQDNILSEDSLESYKSWIKQSRKNIIRNQGIQALQQYVETTKKDSSKQEPKQQDPNKEQKSKEKKSQKKKEKINKVDPNLDKSQTNQVKHYYSMLQISSISDLLWGEFERLLQKSQKQKSQLYCRLIISLEEEQRSGMMRQYPKKITTDLIRLQKRQKIDKKSGSSPQYCYFTDEKFSIYFHTKKESINIKIQMILYDVEKYQNEKETNDQQIKRQAQLVIREECFSFVRIPINIKKQIQKQEDFHKLGYSALRHLRKQFQKYDNIHLHDTGVADKTNTSDKTAKIVQKVVQKVIKGQEKERDFNMYGTLHFNIINSEYYKLLGKFIPSEYLVWHQDLIPGLLGAHLPKVDDNLFRISPSTESKSLQFDIINLQLQAEWIEKAQQKALKRFNTLNMIKLSQNSKTFQTSHQFRQNNLSLIFHNGIKEINRISFPLIQKMEVQKRMQINPGERITSKFNLKPENNHLITIKIFSTSTFFMPQIFYEPNCFIILQINQNLELKEFDSTQNSEKIQQFLIPVAFAFFEPEKILNNKSMDTKLYEGWYMNLENFEKSKILKSARNIVLNSVNNIFQSRSNIGSYKSNFQIRDLTFSKASVFCSLKEPQFDQTWNAQKQKLQESLLLYNQGLGVNRSSLLNNEEARIEAEKEKVLKKMSNALVNVTKGTRKEMKKIQVRDQIALTQNPEGLYFSISSEMNKNVQKKHIKYMKDFLKRHLQVNYVSQNISKPTNHFLEQVFSVKKPQNFVKTQKIYKYSFNPKDNVQSHYFKSYHELFNTHSLKSQNITLPTHFCYSPSLFKMFYDLPSINPFFANNNSNPYSRITQNNSVAYLENKDNLSQFGYERTPIEILRTQLAQVNYNYLILINPISLKSLQTANNSYFTLPNKFFLKIFFWNMENSHSPCFQVDPQTGQIVVFIEKTEPKEQPKTKNSSRGEEIKVRSMFQVSKKEIQTKKDFDQNKLKLKKVFHFQYGTEQYFTNSKELFMQFIDYLYNGLMEIRLYDQFQQIGRTYVKLRNLLRKRRNETSTIIEDFIYSKSGPLCQIRLECKSLRKQKSSKVPLKQQAPKENTVKQNQQKQVKKNPLVSFKENSPSKSNLHQQKSRATLEQVPRPSIDFGLLKQSFLPDTLIDPVDKQKERIQRFKKLKQQKNQTQSPVEVKQKQAIHKLIERNYLASQYKFKVFAFEKSYFLVQLQNRSNKKGLFFVNATDDDYPFYKDVLPEIQIKIIRNFHSELPENDKERILAIQSNRQRLLKYRKLNENYEIQLQDKEKLIVICQYQTKRKYCPQNLIQNETSKTELYKTYNHRHTITVSLLEAVNQSVVSSISKLYIFPEPSQNLIQIQETIKKGQKSMFCLPFLLSSVIKEKYDVYINENRCNIICQGSAQTDDERAFNSTTVSNPRQKYYQSPRHQKAMLESKPGQEQDWKAKIDKNVSIFGAKNKDFVKQDQLNSLSPSHNRTRQLNLSAHKNFVKTIKLKQFNFVSIFLAQKQGFSCEQPQINSEKASKRHLNAIFVPKNSNSETKSIFIQLLINQVKSEELIKIPLFEPIKTTLKIHHNSLMSSNGRMPKVVGIVCQSHQFKLKETWIELEKSKSFTQIEFRYTSTMYGARSFVILVIDPLKYSNFYKNALKSEAVISELEQSYIHRILYTVMTPFPSLKTQLVINLPMNHASSKQGYDEPFIYTNSTVHNIVFHIFTTHPWFLCVEEKDKVSEVKARSEKKLKLKINARKIFEEYLYAIRGQSQNSNRLALAGTKFANERETARESRDLLPVIVLSFVSDRVVEHFGISFKIV